MNEPTDPTEGYALAVPFVVCTSAGGPYDDQAFTAGFAAGTIDRSLTVATAAEADVVSFTTYAQLIPQLELIGMHRGYPRLEIDHIDGAPDLIIATFERGDTP